MCDVGFSGSCRAAAGAAAARSSDTVVREQGAGAGHRVGGVGVQLAAAAGRPRPESPGRPAAARPPPACTVSSLRARPGAQPPGRDPDGERVEADAHPDRSADHVLDVRATGSGADGSPPCAAIIRSHTGVRRAGREHGGRIDVAISASASISRASATVSSTTSAGPPPRSTSTDSVDLQRVADRPPERHGHVGEQRGGGQAVRRRRGRPSSSASSRAGRAVFMNAPEPTLTSSTSPPVPSAIFLLMIELAISGMASTVPVTSRSA